MTNSAPIPEPVKRVLRFAGKKRSEVSNPCLTAREIIVIANWIQANLATHAPTSRRPQDDEAHDCEDQS